MDVEAPKPHPTLSLAMNIAKGNNFKLALTNPCFEYWYLLHLEKTSRPFINKELLSRLRETYPWYSKKAKAGDKIYIELFPHTDKAIKRASELLAGNTDADYPLNNNSSTHIHLLIKRLQEARGR